MPSPLSSEFNERLVTLCDGRTGLRSGLRVEIFEASDPASGLMAHAPEAQSPVTHHPLPTLDFIASDETLDRCDEVIAAGGWRLDSYRRNPVFQNAHQYGDIIFTLGKALSTEVRTVAGRQALFQRVQFATDANPMARIAYALYKGKFLNAVSVGFIPLRWVNGDGTERELGRVASLSPSDGERAGERGHRDTHDGRTGSPLPSDGRGVRGEGLAVHFAAFICLSFSFSAPKFPSSQHATKLSVTDFNSSQRARICCASLRVI